LRSAPISMRGGSSPWNFSALPIRFWKTAASSAGSARTCGSGPAWTSAPDSSNRARQAHQRLLQDLVAVDQRSLARHVPDPREGSRSLISCCMRLAPSTANAMYCLPRSSSSWS